MTAPSEILDGGNTDDVWAEYAGEATDETAQAKNGRYDGDAPRQNTGELALAFGVAAMTPRSVGTVVRGLAHAGALTLIYGPPKSGKSFLATDLALSIAAAEPAWCGHEIRRPGAVLYAAAEGHAGFWKRLRAAARRRGWTDKDFPPGFILAHGRPVLIRTDDNGRTFGPDPTTIMEAMDAATAAGVPVVAVVVDTIFRTVGSGNVNASDHMNAYTAALDAIAATGVAVLAVHHEVKSGGSPAGSVTLTGAADDIVHVWRRDDERFWQVEAAKDDSETPARRFHLEVVEIGNDPEGFAATSCVVVDDGATDGASDAPKRHDRRRPKPRPMSIKYLGALRDALVAFPQPSPGTVAREAWQAELTRHCLLPPPAQAKDEERRRQNVFSTNVRRMIGEGLVASSDGGTTFTDPTNGERF